MVMWKSLSRFRDAALLFLRVGLGVSFMIHGTPKLFGGPEMWEQLGASAGLPFAQMFFGFAGGFVEFLGGILLTLGLFFRPTTVLLVVTMIFAFWSHVRVGDPFVDYSHSMELAIVFLALFIIGPGRFSLDERTT